LDDGRRKVVSAAAALNGDGAVVHQDGIARVQAAVVAAVDLEHLAADADLGVAARGIAPDSRAGVVGEALGRRRAGAVAIGDDNGVTADLRLDASECEVVGAAAGGG
jgi:hypothetical protein